MRACGRFEARFESSEESPACHRHGMTGEILLFHCECVAAVMNERRIHQIFALSVSLKGLHALLEIAGGVALYVTSTAVIVGSISNWSNREIAQERHDWIASHLLLFAQGFSVEKHHFYAFYLLSHGLVKIILV